MKSESWSYRGHKVEVTAGNRVFIDGNDHTLKIVEQGFKMTREHVNKYIDHYLHSSTFNGQLSDYIDQRAETYLSGQGVHTV